MVEFNVISRDFYPEYSGFAYSSSRLTCNSGERIAMVKTIQIGTSVNLSETLDMTYVHIDATYAYFECATINWESEGLFTGATISIEWSATTVTGIVVNGITGVGNNRLVVPKSALTTAGLTDGTTATDFKFKVTTAPVSLNYKYGIIDEGSPANYNSLFGTSENAFYKNGITGSYLPMTSLGSFNSHVLSDVVNIKFDSTASSYLHTFTINHIFRTPFYLDGEEVNLLDNMPPSRLISGNTYKYVDQFIFGDASGIGLMQVQDNSPSTGNFGWFNENFNGLTNNYEIQDLEFSNTAASGTIEVTQTTTVEFNLKNNLGSWAGGETLLLTHSRLPSYSEYADKTETFNDIWLIDSILQYEGGASASSTIITNFNGNIDGSDPTLINILFDITYTTPEQELFSDGDGFLITLDVATQDVSDMDITDRVRLKIYDTCTFNTDVDGLITNFQPLIYPIWDNYTGAITSTDYNGWDGDYWGNKFTFDLDATRSANILDPMDFSIYADDGTDKFVICSLSIPVGNPIAPSRPIITPSGSSYSYQLMNTYQNDSSTLPIDAEMRLIKVTSAIPAASTPTQTVVVQFPKQICWRDWVFNPNVPTSFFDAAELNNNLNRKTSNYSGVSGFNIYGVLTVRVSNDVYPTTPTTYELYTDSSDVNDFDVVGATSPFVGDVQLFDGIYGASTDNIFINEEVQIDVLFTHSLGTLSDQNLRGIIWIEKDGGTESPWFLSSTQDYTSALNPLTPTDTLATGNTTLVEIISGLNTVVLRCKTNRENLVNGVSYNIYGRLYTR